ncbi:hypothetical protein STEG23_014060, partial [Scotinomys teguina]
MLDRAYTVLRGNVKRKCSFSLRIQLMQCDTKSFQNDFNVVQEKISVPIWNKVEQSLHLCDEAYLIMEDLFDVFFDLA